MRIGIVVHSDTGNTLQVAEALQAKLIAGGHQVTLERLQAVGNPKPGDRSAELAAVPKLSGYEALVLAAPVHGFSLSGLMTKCLGKVGTLEGKPAVLLVTQAFPKPWLGGNRAVRQMSQLAKAKGAEVKGTGVINWPKHEEQIPVTTDRLAQLF